MCDELDLDLWAYEHIVFVSRDYRTFRGRKVLEVRTLNDEERIQQLEKELEITILFGEEADRKYEEVSK